MNIILMGCEYVGKSGSFSDPCVRSRGWVPEVINRFEEEYNNSLIRNRFVLDTTSNSPSESFMHFSHYIESKLALKDQSRLLG